MPNKGFSDEEKAAMKERAKEALGGKTEGVEAVMAKINAMLEPDKTLAKRVHEIVVATAPQLSPKTWYGMPAYADKEGKVVCFFQPASKFKYRYSTLGFNDKAMLDEGDMWATTFAIHKLSPEVEKRIEELVKKAVK